MCSDRQDEALREEADTMALKNGKEGLFRKLRSIQNSVSLATAVRIVQLHSAQCTGCTGQLHSCSCCNVCKVCTV